MQAGPFYFREIFLWHSVIDSFLFQLITDVLEFLVSRISFPFSSRKTEVAQLTPLSSQVCVLLCKACSCADSDCSLDMKWVESWIGSEVELPLSSPFHFHTSSQHPSSFSLSSSSSPSRCVQSLCGAPLHCGVITQERELYKSCGFIEL